MWYTHTMKYYSAIKKEWNNAIFSKMDGPWDDHTKWSKLERERPILYDITCMWHKWAYLQNRNRLTDIENRCADAKGKGVGEEWIGSWGLADAKYYILQKTVFSILWSAIIENKQTNKKAIYR